jgi:hypothetical protein
MSPNFMQASRTTMNEMLYFITKIAIGGLKTALL